jgi:hypothetical protein
MKRSFKVATIFTGAAACAVALAPMAEAAPLAPGTANTTDAIHGDCNPNTTHPLSFHLYYTQSEKHSLAACFSGVGKYPIAKEKFAYYCAGEWSGYVWIKGVRTPFGSKKHDLYGQSISQVSLTGLNGPKASSCSTYGSVWVG